MVRWVVSDNDDNLDKPSSEFPKPFLSASISTPLVVFSGQQTKDESVKHINIQYILISKIPGYKEYSILHISYKDGLK